MEAEGSSIKRDRGYREGHGLQTIRRIRRWLWGATLLILGMAALSTCDKFDFFGELEAASQVTETGALSLNPELSIVSLNNDVNLDASGAAILGIRSTAGSRHFSGHETLQKISKIAKKMDDFRKILCGRGFVLQESVTTSSAKRELSPQRS